MRKCPLFLFTFILIGCATQKTHHNDWYGVDKIAHFGVTAVIAAGVTNYKESRAVESCDAARIGFSVSLAVGASKELYDKSVKKTRWSWEDIAFDALGGLVGSLSASNC